MLKFRIDGRITRVMEILKCKSSASCASQKLIKFTFESSLFRTIFFDR